jgi:hypothetical protein
MRPGPQRHDGACRLRLGGPNGRFHRLHAFQHRFRPLITRSSKHLLQDREHKVMETPNTHPTSGSCRSGSETKDVLYYADQLRNGPPPAEPIFRDHEFGHYHEGRQNRAEICKALRGEPKALSEEYCITILKDRMGFYLQNGTDLATHKWGFVCYRPTYAQSPSEWGAFKQALEAKMFRSGRWIVGYDSIAESAGLEYVSGRDVGVAEGDIEATKQ